MITPLHPALRWPGYLAATFLILIPIAVLMVRSGNWQQGLLLYAIACLASGLLLVWYVIAALLPRNKSSRSNILTRALPALPGTVLLAMIFASPDVPPIHDISTDLENPPEFSAVVELRSREDNSLAVDPEVLELQADAYPDIQTLRSERPLEATFRRAENIARELGWDIVRSDLNAGVIEASDTTRIMAFTDDIAIRVNSDADGTLVDLRSASRVGLSDIGTNAERIRAFSEQFRKDS